MISEASRLLRLFIEAKGRDISAELRSPAVLLTRMDPRCYDDRQKRRAKEKQIKEGIQATLLNDRQREALPMTQETTFTKSHGME